MEWRRGHVKNGLKFRWKWMSTAGGGGGDHVRVQSRDNFTTSINSGDVKVGAVNIGAM